MSKMDIWNRALYAQNGHIEQLMSVFVMLIEKIEKMLIEKKCNLCFHISKMDIWKIF